MERKEIINKLSKYFKVSELVCPHTYKKWGESSWRFLDTNALLLLLVLREDIFKKPIVINNLKSNLTQRGLRCNLCELVKSKNIVYISAHILGKGWDLNVQGQTAEESRKIIVANQDKLPCSVRLESDVTWVHIDVMPVDSDEKISFFKG